MEVWNGTVYITPNVVKLLITDGAGDELLRARLPRRCEHPRALLTLLEGLALWCGEPLHVVTSAGDPVHRTSALDLFGGEGGPAESALVRLEVVERRRVRRLRGLGDFGDVLNTHQRTTR